jgi:hypothetical protein
LRLEHAFAVRGAECLVHGDQVEVFLAGHAHSFFAAQGSRDLNAYVRVNL